MITESSVDTADAMRAISAEICRLGARLDQVEAARRDLLTPVANIPAPDDSKEIDNGR